MDAQDVDMATAVLTEDRTIYNDRILHVQRLSDRGWDRDLRGFFQQFQDSLNTQAMKDHQDRQNTDRREYLDRSGRERSQDLEQRVFGPARGRQQAAAGERERMRQIAEAERLAKEAQDAERGAAWTQKQADRAASRAAEANAREVHARAAAARARAIELERKADELKRQELLAQRRAEALAALAEEQLRNAEAKQRRDADKQAQLQANEQRIEDERQRMEARFDDKIDRVNRYYMRKWEVMQEAQLVREDVCAMKSELKDLLKQCARTRNYEPLRARLDQFGLSPAMEGLASSRPSSAAPAPQRHAADGGPGLVPSAPSTPRRSRPLSARRRQATTPRPAAASVRPYVIGGAWTAAPAVPLRTMPPHPGEPMESWSAAVAAAAAAAAASGRPRLTPPGWRQPAVAVKGGGSGSLGAVAASPGSTTAEIAASLASPSSCTSKDPSVYSPYSPAPAAREPLASPTAFDAALGGTMAAGTGLAAIRQRQEAVNASADAASGPPPVVA